MKTISQKITIWLMKYNLKNAIKMQETQRRLNQCNSKRKQEAGYDQSISFDIVWEETLKKAQS